MNVTNTRLRTHRHGCRIMEIFKSTERRLLNYGRDHYWISGNVTTITLVARYFGLHNEPDEITTPCKSLSLFEAEIEVEYDASGVPQYQHVIRPAFVSAKGIDASVIRELSWKPQQLLFRDSATGAEREFFLAGIDATKESNTVEFLISSP
jgi:hypothetical protein